MLLIFFHLFINKLIVDQLQKMTDGERKTSIAIWALLVLCFIVYRHYFSWPGLLLLSCPSFKILPVFIQYNKHIASAKHDKHNIRGTISSFEFCYILHVSLPTLQICNSL